LSDVGLALQFLVSLGLLYASAEALVFGASRLAAHLRIPSLIVGLTIVALGTSLPEAFVCIIASLRPEPDAIYIALGNIVGSNVANVGLILGVGALFGALIGDRKDSIPQIGWLMGGTILFLLLVWFATEKSGAPGILGSFGLSAGIFLMALYAAFMCWLATFARHHIDREAPEDDDKQFSLAFCLVTIALGVAFLWISSKILVQSAEVIALKLNVPEKVIGFTMVALGTSLPELAAAIVSLARREKGLLLGNVIGSNIANLLFAGGVTGLFSGGVRLKANFLWCECALMLAFTLPLLLFLVPNFKLGKRFGAGLILAYVVVIAAQFVLRPPA